MVCKLGATDAKSNVVNAGIITGQVKFISHVQEEYTNIVHLSTEYGFSKASRIKTQREVSASRNGLELSLTFVTYTQFPFSGC